MARVRGARVARTTYRRGMYPMYGVAGYDYYLLKKPIKVTVLQRLHRRAWGTWMVDDPPHWYAMQRYAERSKGRVAVAGLGLGLVTHALLRNRDVTRIDVYEIDPDVIELVGPKFDLKLRGLPHLRIERADAGVELADPKGPLYERIILDLWVASGKEEVERVLWSEAIPFTRAVRLAHPESSIVVHGFGGVPEQLADIVARTMQGLKLP